MTTDKLSEIRSVARARGQEDFEYFSSSVLGLKIPSDLCREIQIKVGQGAAPCELRDYAAEKKMSARDFLAVGFWMSVLGKANKVPYAPTETFQWLFGECVEKAA